MIAEARRRGLVTITVNRPLHTDPARSRALQTAYPNLERATVVTTPLRADQLHGQLGRSAAPALRDYLHDGAIIGITWGQSLAATAKAMTRTTTRDLTVVQLAGAVADLDTCPHLIMKQLGHILRANTVALNAPLVVASPELATALMRDPTNRITLDLGVTATIALIGVGTTDPDTASLVRTGHMTRGGMVALERAGAIGEAGGYPIAADGTPISTDYETRLVAIPRSKLLQIPTRLAIAGGAHKAPSISAAIAGGYITHLVTDSNTVDRLLKS